MITLATSTRRPIRIRSFPIAALFAAAATGAASADTGWVVWSQPVNSNWAIVPSFSSTSPTMDIEVADDFEVSGTIARIVASGYECFNCAPGDVSGVFVRFYGWTPTGPSALDAEIFVPASDPGLLLGAGLLGTVDVTLPSAVDVVGKGFVSVQLAFDGPGSWDWWTTNVGNPNGSGAMTRDRSSGPTAPWSPIEDIFGPLNADVGIMLWGDNGNPPAPGSDPCGTWTVTPSANPASTDHAIFRDVVAISPDDAWAVGEYTSVVQGSNVTLTLVERWDGTQWTVIPSPNPTACPSCTYATFDAVAAMSATEIWAAGGKRVQGPDGFLGTHIFVARCDLSGGSPSWTVMNTPLTVGASGSHVQDIEIVGPNDIWFFGDWAGPGWPSLAMHWNGSSFSVVSTPTPAGGTPGWGLEAGSALGPDDIWAVGGGSDGDYSASGYIIHWDGSSWTRVQGPTPGTYQRLWDVLAIASDDVWAVGDYLQAGVGYFPLYLHWDGRSWSQVESPGGGRGLVAFAPDNIYSAGSGVVHWDGSTWTEVASFPSVIGPSILALSGSSLCDLWGVGRQITAGDLLTFTAHLQPVDVGSFTTPGDLDGDATVGPADLAVLLAAWGPCRAGGCAADLDGDLDVDAADLATLLAGWTG